ncbi:hypothetical protein NMG60_11036333, partial [Bertholletia excelsa]
YFVLKLSCRMTCRMWWVMLPCVSRKILRSESREDIEEILKAKLATIEEESEAGDENHRGLEKRGKKISYKISWEITQRKLQEGKI